MMSHANLYFTEDFIPTKGLVYVVTYDYIGTVSAGATLKMLVACKLWHKL